MIVIAIILGLAGLIAIVGGGVARSGIAVGSGIVGLLLGGGLTVASCAYTQDIGEASVIVNWTGNIQGQETAPGLHWKSPFASVETFSIRNQQVSFIGNGSTNYAGGSAQGPDVTATDAQGVASDIDISVRYSIDSGKVTQIYRQYHDEQSFVSNYVTQTIRAVVRKVPNTYQTIDILTKQGQLQTDITTALTSAFNGSGVSVDNVSLQGVNPPEAIKAGYAKAQQAQIQVTTEQANLQAAQVSAQQAVVEAKANAEANRLLTKSLSSQVLQQHYIDTLGKLAQAGNLVVVPANGSTLVNIPSK